MQSIITTYLGPTNKRGARIKATATGGKSITIGIGHESVTDSDGQHDMAAVALCLDLKWTGQLVRGAMKRGNVYVFNTESERLEVK